MPVSGSQARADPGLQCIHVVLVLVSNDCVGAGAYLTENPCRATDRHRGFNFNMIDACPGWPAAERSFDALDAAFHPPPLPPPAPTESGRWMLWAGVACALVAVFGYAIGPVVVERYLADVDELGALGRMRHPLPRLIEFPRPVGGRHSPESFGMDRPFHPKGLRDAFGGDVVVRRPDPAGGEDIGEFSAHLVDRRDDRLRDVRDDPRLAQPDADLVQPRGDIGKVRVLRPAREDLVADDEDTGAGALIFIEREWRNRPSTATPGSLSVRCVRRPRAATRSAPTRSA